MGSKQLQYITVNIEDINQVGNLSSWVKNMMVVPSAGKNMWMQYSIYLLIKLPYLTGVYFCQS